VERVFQEICTPARKVSPDVLTSVLKLAVEIAREGREGHKVGTLFTVGAEDQVLRRSRPLILDPLAGHAEQAKQIDEAAVRETVKELAQLDGAFIVSGKGVVISAARFLEASTKDVTLPLGLGTRHMAAMAMSHCTDAVAVVVSTSSVVRVFDDGEIVGEILPESGFAGQESIYIKNPAIDERESERLVVVSKKRGT